MYLICIGSGVQTITTTNTLNVGIVIRISIKLMLKPSPFKDIAKADLGTTIGKWFLLGLMI